MAVSCPGVTGREQAMVLIGLIIIALVFMVFMLASVGLPGTSGFPGEFLVMTGLFQINTWVAAFICTGIILGAAPPAAKRRDDPTQGEP